MNTAIALLKLALALLIAAQSPSVPTSLRVAATNLANHAIAAAEQSTAPQGVTLSKTPPTLGPTAGAVLDCSTTTQQLSSPDTSTLPDLSTPGISTPNTPAINESVVTAASISVTDFGYYKSKINAPHCIAPSSVKSADDATQDCQVVNLAVYLYDASGNILRDADLTASSTDGLQNKIIHGTGTAEGYYAFPYLFRDATSTIEFTAGNADQSITLFATQ